MITEFIGQGLDENPNQSTGNYIRTSLKELDFNKITFFTAFLRKSGLNEIKNELVKNKRGIIFYVGIDEQITSKEALELLLELNIDAYIYNSISNIYHPKFYIFEGNIRTRIILGSSNLTKAGLFYNVESSILLDFSNNDKSGLKLLRQLKNYFEPLYDFTSDNLVKVTPSYIEYLFDNGLISSEDIKSNGVFNSTHDKGKAKNRLPKIPKLEDVEIDEKSGYKRYYYELKITDEYLEKWDFMFLQMKAFKEKYNKTTIPSKYHDRSLYAWYRKQKDIYNHPILKMPDEHLNKLNSIKFHFADGHKERERNIELKWLNILKQAIDDKEDIKVNHRYTYKGEKLGTFLVGVKSANKNNKKQNLRKEIENLGFDYEVTSRKPNIVLKRFIEELINDENPNKAMYQSRFNSNFLPKKNRLKAELKAELNEVWELQFNETRSWEKNKRLLDRTLEWKEFRYNKKINPNKKWYIGQTSMGSKLYTWVRKRKIDDKLMKLILNKFNDKEKIELKEEGFFIE